MGTLSIDNLAIQLTTPLLLRKPCKLFASVARVCQRQLGFLVEYLDDFVKDLSKLLSDGITENEVHGDVAVDCFVCDAPAHVYEKNVKTFSGYYRCDKCSQEGEYFDGKVTFPVTTALLCTDADFNNKINEEHHNGPTPLSSLTFGLVTGLDDVSVPDRDSSHGVSDMEDIDEPVCGSSHGVSGTNDGDINDVSEEVQPTA